MDSQCEPGIAVQGVGQLGGSARPSPCRSLPANPPSTAFRDRHAPELLIDIAGIRSCEPVLRSVSRLHAVMLPKRGDSLRRVEVPPAVPYVDGEPAITALSARRPPSRHPAAAQAT